MSVVIGTYNRLEFLKSTIDTTRHELTSINHEIIVVDGGSTDGTIEWLINQKDVISIIQHNRGEWQGRPIERKSWSYFMNLGFRAASGKYICMLSDDCLVIPGAIKNGLKLFESEIKKRHKIGAIAFYWRNWPEQEQYWVGLTWGGKMFVNHGLYLKDALQSIGFADEDYKFYHADGDICLKLSQAKYKCIDCPSSFIEHYSDANTEVRTSNMATQQEDWQKYTKQWSYLGTPDVDWVEKKFYDKDKTAERHWIKSKKFSLRRKA